MKIINVLLFIVLFISTCYGQSDLKEKFFVKLASKYQFISQDQGVVAFMPGVHHMATVKGAIDYYALPETGIYEFARRGNLFFLVNHYGSENKKSYVGVTVCVIFPSWLGTKKGYSLKRNEAKWVPGGEGRSLSNKLEGPEDCPPDAKPYFDAHKQNELSQCDKILKFTWHAATETGSTHSWAYKNKWASAEPPRLNEFINLLGIHKDEYKPAITAYILQFTTSSSKDSKNPVYFWFNADDALGAYVNIFSPLGNQFDKSFYIRFK